MIAAVASLSSDSSDDERSKRKKKKDLYALNINDAKQQTNPMGPNRPQAPWAHMGPRSNWTQMNQNGSQA